MRRDFAEKSKDLSGLPTDWNGEAKGKYRRHQPDQGTYLKQVKCTQEGCIHTGPRQCPRHKPWVHIRPRCMHLHASARRTAGLSALSLSSFASLEAATPLAAPAVPNAAAPKPAPAVDTLAKVTEQPETPLQVAVLNVPIGSRSLDKVCSCPSLSKDPFCRSWENSFHAARAEHAFSCVYAAETCTPSRTLRFAAWCFACKAKHGTCPRPSLDCVRRSHDLSPTSDSDLQGLCCTFQHSGVKHLAMTW